MILFTVIFKDGANNDKFFNVHWLPGFPGSIFN
jgi:hypothetical protein